jgi:hypothetical protein
VPDTNECLAPVLLTVSERIEVRVCREWDLGQKPWSWKVALEPVQSHEVKEVMNSLHTSIPGYKVRRVWRVIRSKNEDFMILLMPSTSQRRNIEQNHKETWEGGRAKRGEERDRDRETEREGDRENPYLGIKVVQCKSYLYLHTILEGFYLHVTNVRIDIQKKCLESIPKPGYKTNIVFYSIPLPVRKE